MPDTQEALSNLTDQLKQTFGEDSVEFKRVIGIGVHIQSTGMSDDDCALLSRVSAATLAEWREKHPVVGLYLRLCRVKYKSKLLEVLTTQATSNKDVKTATYLLERTFSEEYDPAVKKEEAKRKQKENPNDSLGELMAHVRKSAPQTPIDENATLAPKQEEKASDALLELSHLVSHG